MFLNPTMSLPASNSTERSRKNEFSFFRDVPSISLDLCVHLATGEADQTDDPTPEEPRCGRERHGRG